MNILKVEKREKSLVPSICIVILLLFVWLCPLATDASAMDYAVQVAAFRSQQSAIDLAKGLRAQGINAYWIGKNLQSQGTIYRVRIGKFSTIESAYLYAEGLMNSGIFSTYAIAAYEHPAPATLIALKKEDQNADKLQAFVSPAGDFAFASDFASTAATVTPPSTATPTITVVTPAPAAPSMKLGTTTIDLIASIGTRGWLLLSSEEVIAATRTQKNPTALGRELAKLAAAVGSRRWSLNNDISKLLGPSVSAPVTPSNSAAPVNIADLARNNSSPFSPVAPAVSSSGPVVRATSTAISAPEIGRRPLPPTTTTPTSPGARSISSIAPPKLQGSIEMRNGKMLMMLQNLDAERSFAGTARITLTTDKDQQEVAPLLLNVAPGQEFSIPVTDARLLNGDWLMMVFDQTGVARYIRGASLAPQPAPSADKKEQPAPLPASTAPPGFVTGMFDANGDWKLTETGPAQTPPGAATPQSGNSAQAETQSQNRSANSTGPVQVSISPRQIAVTPENVTVEFDIMSSRPLNYIVVSIRSGDFQDSRQALMSMVSGRVPFLIPADSAKGAFSYEVKDDMGKVLASGSGDFRQFE